MDDINFESAAKIPIIVARYAGSPMMLEKLDDAVRVHQTNEKVVHATRLVAKLLERVILGSSILDALRWAETSDQISVEEKEYLHGIEESGSNGSLPFSLAVETLGLSNQLPGCLKSSIYALKCFRGYEIAVRANIIAGGDNACRNVIVGSFLAAEMGDKSIPLQWKNKTLQYSLIVSLANRIAGSNSHFDISREKGCTFFTQE
jgi:ADP-ribosylglycohydrolase